MKSVIYIYHNEVQLVAYNKTRKKVRIEKVACVKLSETAVINGIITDSNEVLEKVQVLYNENKKYFRNVTLILDSSSIMIKKIPVPKLKKWQYDKLIEEELSDMTRPESRLIYDYIHIKSSSETRNILACGVDSQLISSYVDIFDKLGIKIKSVQVGFEGIVDYISDNNEFRGKSIVINILDGYSLLSIIFQDGELIFWKRSRVLAENNEEKVNFMLNEISTLMQFSKSQNLTPITEFYYIGYSKELLSSIESGNQNPQISILNFDIPDNIKNSRMISDNAGIVLFSILSSDQDINFLNEYKKPRKKRKEGMKFKASYIAYPVIILCFAGVFAYFKYDTKLQEDKINEANKYLINEKVLIDLEEANKIKNQINIKSEAVKDLTEYETMLNAYPEVTIAMLNHIMISAGDNIIINNIDFDGSKKVLSISCVGTSENDGNNYIYKLKSDKTTQNVEYTGYKVDDLGKYGFDVKISLGSGEGE